VDILDSYCVVNASVASKPDKAALAKKFVSFCYADENLGKFTEITGVARGLNYTLTEANKQGMSSYKINVWNVRETANIVYPRSDKPIFINNEGTLNQDVWKAVVGGQTYALPYTAFRGSVSAAAYFEGLRISQADWDQKYSQWF
jgi:hypothetical protein